VTHTEMLAVVDSGGRVRTNSSMHDSEKVDAWCRHDWRVIACDSDRDIVECRKCGKQKTCRCCFDEDFA
jgi:hypothetical protein